LYLLFVCSFTVFLIGAMWLLQTFAHNFRKSRATVRTAWEVSQLRQKNGRLWRRLSPAFLVVAIRLLWFLQTIFESLERQSEQPGKCLRYDRKTDAYEGVSRQLFWSWQCDSRDFCRRFLKVSSDSQNSLGSVSATTEKRTLMKASLASFSDRGNVTPETLADDFWKSRATVRTAWEVSQLRQKKGRLWRRLSLAVLIVALVKPKFTAKI